MIIGEIDALLAMAILKTIKFESISGSPGYFDWTSLEVADYYVITDDGKAYAIWGGKEASWNGWYAAEIQCTETGKQSTNIWRRLSGATISPMESEKFQTKKDLMSAIEGGSIRLTDRTTEKDTIRQAVASGAIPVPGLTSATGGKEPSGCLAILAGIGLSAASLTTLALWLQGVA